MSQTVQVAKKRAVIFDYYGTLVYLDAGRHAMWDLVRNEAQCDVSNAELDRIWFETAETLSPEVLEHFVTLKESWALRGAELARRLGISLEGEFIAHNYDRAHSSATVFADAIECLSRLRDRYQVGLLSNADASHLVTNLEANALKFDAVEFSERVRCYKPDARIFYMTCEALGVEAQGAIYVGDSPLADVEGARGAGLRSIWIDRLGKEWPLGLTAPDARIESLAELDSQIAFAFTH